MADQKRTITKLSLYLRLMRISIIIGAALGLGFGIFLVIGIFLFEHDNIFGLFPVFYIVRNFVGIVLFVGMILHTPLSLKSIYWIKKQEDFLGFRFHEEMEAYNIDMAQLPYRSGNWFIAVYYFQAIAIRRDYIVKLENYRMYREEGGQEMAGITLVCADGKKRKIRGVPRDMIYYIQLWVEQEK